MFKHNCWLQLSLPLIRTTKRETLRKSYLLDYCFKHGPATASPTDYKPENVTLMGHDDEKAAAKPPKANYSQDYKPEHVTLFGQQDEKRAVLLHEITTPGTAVAHSAFTFLFLKGEGLPEAKGARGDPLPLWALCGAALASLVYVPCRACQATKTG